MSNPPVHCMVTGGLNLISQLLTHMLTKATDTLKQNMGLIIYLFIVKVPKVPVFFIMQTDMFACLKNTLNIVSFSIWLLSG